MNLQAKTSLMSRWQKKTLLTITVLSLVFIFSITIIYVELLADQNIQDFIYKEKNNG